MTDPRMTTTDAPVTVEGYAEAEAMVADIMCSVRISDTAIRVARDHMMQFARHRLAALASAPVADGLPDGWQAVPRTPTGAMTRAGGLAFNDDPDVLSVTAHEASQAWTAMLAAAPAALARPRAAVGEREA